IISSPSRTTTIPLSFGNTTASYFNATWISKKIDNGECIIYAKVYDEFNNTAISESVNITIFNDDIPPSIVFTSPKDGASHTENTDITIHAVLSDIHHDIANATLVIETEKREIQKIYINKSIINFTWKPTLGESGNCFIRIEAYDTKNNLGRSEDIFIFIQKSYLMRNTLILFSIISVVAVTILNKYAKKLLSNKKIMDYFGEIGDFIRKPSKAKLKRIDPTDVLQKDNQTIEAELDRVNELILEKRYKKAFLLSEFLLRHLSEFKGDERLMAEIQLILEEIMKDLRERLGSK
ncbi:MAG: hypothetical protein R6U96_15570, partial [Promethearchaeia archaeon]